MLSCGLQTRVPLIPRADGCLADQCASCAVVRSIDGPFFLRAAGKLDSMLAHIRGPTKTLILRMGNVPCVDATGICALRELVAGSRRHGATVVLVEVRPRVLLKLTHAGVIAHVGADNVIDTLEHAQTRTKAIDRVRHQ